MRAANLGSAVGTSALLLCALAPASGAQRAPIIRVYSSNGAYTLATTSYVTPVIEVSENAYVFAVSMDVDGQIQVLQPDFPGISVRMLAHKRLNLPNFFTGFSRQSDRSRYYSSAAYAGGYDTYNNDGYSDSRGTVIALASRAPFNLDLIASGGDWDMATIRRLIDNRTPQMAAQSLANYLGVKGEPIGRDYMRFAGGQNYNSAYAYGNGYYSGCDLYGYAYTTTLASRYFYANTTIAQLRSRGQRATIGYDICGFPFVIFHGSSGQLGGTRPPTPRDTSLIPRSRLGDHGKGRPRLPQSASRPVPQGVFPIPQRAELPQMGDVTIKAPKGRRSEPGQFLQGYRDQPGTMSAPQGRVPVERISTPRNEPAAATGAMPVRESRPEPRVYTPPPTRAEPPPSAPAPVTRDRPSTPPPPPPRVEAPTVTNRPTPSRH